MRLLLSFNLPSILSCGHFLCFLWGGVSSGLCLLLVAGFFVRSETSVTLLCGHLSILFRLIKIVSTEKFLVLFKVYFQKWDIEILLSKTHHVSFILQHHH